MNEEQRERKKQYSKEWYLAHRDEKKAKSRQWASEHREEKNKKRRECYAKHPEEYREYTRKWKREHPEEHKAIQKRCYENRKKENEKKPAEWQEENRKQTNKIRRELNHKYRIEALTHYGNGELACVRCGENDIRCLSIDHINGNGAEHRQKIKGRCTNMARILRKEGFPEGYQTLCMNCQWKKRYENHEVSYG